MIILIVILILGSFLAALLLLGAVARIVQALGLLAMFILGVTVIAVGYISLFIAGISLAGLYQFWGSENAGWAVAAAGLIGLTVAATMLRAIFNEIKNWIARLKHWLGMERTG